MNRFLKIARSASPCASVQFRLKSYGRRGAREFLRDVMALANASIDGPRYIVIGIGYDSSSNRTIRSVDQSDFAGKPSYGSLASDFIEPPLRVRYKPVDLSDKRVGVLEIGDSQDRPYMMKSDFSERLRRGDAYIRIDGQPLKMGRRQLQEMFEKKFRESVTGDRIEIGFPGEIIHKDKKIRTIDIGQLPSAVASANMQQLIEAQKKSRQSASTDGIVRLTHARLFGSDSPYEDKSPTILLDEMKRLKKKYQYEDQYHLFEKHASKLQLVIYNQGEDTIKDASLLLVMPNHNEFFVASQLPKIPRDGDFVDDSSNSLIEYPAVTLKDDSVEVSATIGEINAGGLVEAFEFPLRVCVGSQLKGRRLGIRYVLFGSNLRQPARGKLRLLF